MKNSELKNIVDSYTELRSKGTDSKIPIKAAWVRRKNLKKILAAYDTYREAFMEIQQRYSDDEHSVEKEDGDRQVRFQYMPQYQKEISELLNLEADVTVEKIDLEDLGDCSLTDVEMDTLAFMIND